MPVHPHADAASGIPIEEAADRAVVGVGCDEVNGAECVDAAHASRLDFPIRFVALDDAEAVNPDVLEVQAASGDDAVLEGLGQRFEWYELLHLSDVGVCGDEKLVLAPAVGDCRVADWLLATVVNFAGEAELEVGIALANSNKACWMVWLNDWLLASPVV